MASRREQITNILKGLNPLDPKVRQDFAEGFKDDYGIGREDTTKMFYRQRELAGKQSDTKKAPLQRNGAFSFTCCKVTSSNLWHYPITEYLYQTTW